MNWMLYLSAIFASVGAAIITCIFMEAYFVRRAMEEMGYYDQDNEEETNVSPFRPREGPAA